MEEKKSYYAIIPANVRYDKRLNANAKLLYGEITALTNEKGFCWASNSYFSKLYDVSNKSISRWINQLVQYGYIQTKINYRPGSKEVLSRYLTIVTSPMDSAVHTPMDKNVHTPMDKNVQDNITLINNKYINRETTTKRFKIPTVEEITAYCSERKNNIDAVYFHAFYDSKGWMVGKNKMKNWKSAVITWEKNQSKFNRDDPEITIDTSRRYLNE